MTNHVSRLGPRATVSLTPSKYLNPCIVHIVSDAHFISEADLFNEITNCLAPELKSFLITDTPETSEKDEGRTEFYSLSEKSFLRICDRTCLSEVWAEGGVLFVCLPGEDTCWRRA